MMTFRAISLRPLGLAAAFLASTVGVPAAIAADADDLRASVDSVVEPLMAANAIPGMAVAISMDGESRIFNYGLAAKENGRPVDDRTLFEVGSISKVFTGTLGALVAAEGKLSLADPAARHLPELAGTAFDRITLLDLATYTTGGLPLQFPDGIADEDDLTAFYRNWRPSFEPGATRLYSNPSIGLFGYGAARAAGVAFDELMTGTLLPQLGLTSTYLRVPEAEMERYAWGSSKDDRPVRVTPGALDSEAYGIKTTAGDMIRFVELSMDPSPLEPPLEAAIAAAQTGYFRFGETMQGLGWEIYDRPGSLDTLLAGNSTPVALEPQPVERLDPPQAPQAGRFVNKTGSTGGFGAYAAFLPEKRLGIVILANRNYPNAERVKAAWAILSALE